MWITPRSDDVFIAVDLQYDFLPGGSLAVAGGDEIIAPINELAQKFRHVVMTQDWHPQGHISFASNHKDAKPYQVIALPYGPQVLWPDHCVQGSEGAAFHPGLDLPSAQAIVRKGFRVGIDSYSGFVEADRATPTAARTSRPGR